MTNVEMLSRVAIALGDLREEVVFIGGATVSLYLEDSASPDVRPTDDVDCIVELATYGDHIGWERRLRGKGFENDMSQGAPICRWLIAGQKVDLMPTDATVLGFSNRWYGPGIRHKRPMNLPGGTEVQILPAPYFIGTKIEAFLDPRRGAGSFRFSHDLEDIIVVLDGRPRMEAEVIAAPEDIRDYLRVHFDAFLKESGFLEAVESCLPAATEGVVRQRRLLQTVRRIAVR